MKRSISVVLTLVLLVGLLPAVNFAAVDYGAWLVEAGLINGGTNGDLMENDNLSRAQMMAILARMLGEEEEALAWKFGSSFNDVPDNKWYAPYIGYAEYKNWTTGTSATTFSPDMKLTGDQAMSFLLTALGYEKGVDFLWYEAREYAELLGIDASVTNEDQLIRGEIFELMYDTLQTNTKGTSTKLGEVLGVIDPVVVVEEFKLEEVKSDYSRFEFELVFNEDLDANALASNAVVVKSGSTTLTTSTVVDGNKIIVFFNSTRAQNSSYTVELKNIVDVEGNKYSATENFILKDVKNPTVEKVEVTSSKTIDIYFSEDIVQASGIGKVWSEIYLDGERAAGTFTQDSTNFHKWTFSSSDKLTYGQLDILIQDFNDVNGYELVTYTETLTVEEDKTPPMVTSVDFVSKTQVKVNFSEPVVSGTLELNNKTVTFTQSASTSYTMSLSGFPLDAASTFSENLLYTSLIDVEGNESDEDGLVFEWKAPVDTSKPTVSISLEDDNDLVLTFSEAMDLSNGLFALLDEDGDLVTLRNGNSIILDDDHKATLSFAALENIDSADYSLDIKNVKDASVVGNSMDPVKFDFTANDTKAPTFEAARLLEEDTFRVIFSEPMSKATLMDLDNYLYENLLLADVDGVTFVVGPDASYIDFTVEGATSGDTISFLGLRDANGVRLDSANFNVNYTISAPNDFNHVDITAKAIDTRTVVITAKNGHSFSTVAPDGFVLRDSYTPSRSYYVTKAVIDPEDPTKVTLTLNTALQTDALTKGTHNVTIYVYTSGNMITDDFNQVLEIASSASVEITDGIKPTVTELKEGPNAGQIEVVLSEEVSAISEDNVLSDILLRDSDNNLITLTNADVSLSNAGAVVFDSFIISNLTTDELYSIEILSRYMTDGTNSIENYEGKITAK